jgi:hypothetical protein
MKVDLSQRPTALTVAGSETIATMNAIREQGGIIAGMAQDGKRNGAWRLSIHWTEPTLALEAIPVVCNDEPMPCPVKP